MDEVIITLTILGGLITLVTFVAITVWAVAQIKETTSNLTIEIRNLSKAVDKMAGDFDDMDRRLRLIEGHKC
jgi:hypothetical protein